MDVILVRYAELGLKSRKVRTRFERMLVDNIMSMLAHDGVEALVSSENGRFYIESNDIEGAARSIKRVFGVASISIAKKVQGGLVEFREAAATLSKLRLTQGQTFKVEARRTGSHTFTSMQAAAEIGEAILEANAGRGIRVDIHHPDVIFYVEIRGGHAYIFTDYIEGPAGLPMGSQGKVLAVLETREDAVAAWLMMKRGCKCIIIGPEDAVAVLRGWDPEIRVIKTESVQDAALRHHVSALVYGFRIKDMDRIVHLRSPLPIFFPLIGMENEEIERRLASISRCH
ncbi:MAG: hypothetical protein HPY73_03990 [Methanomassiliicoccales archaeon]|nr:MAG: hypothetical protein HPY73_03990 [Methanomassiliicoccales archaeon]